MIWFTLTHGCFEVPWIRFARNRQLTTERCTMRRVTVAAIAALFFVLLTQPSRAITTSYSESFITTASKYAPQGFVQSTSLNVTDNCPVFRRTPLQLGDSYADGALFVPDHSRCRLAGTRLCVGASSLSHCSRPSLKAGDQAARRKKGSRRGMTRNRRNQLGGE